MVLSRARIAPFRKRSAAKSPTWEDERTKDGSHSCILGIPLRLLRKLAEWGARSGRKIGMGGGATRVRRCGAICRRPLGSVPCAHRPIPQTQCCGISNPGGRKDERTKDGSHSCTTGIPLRLLRKLAEWGARIAPFRKRSVAESPTRAESAASTEPLKSVTATSGAGPPKSSSCTHKKSVPTTTRHQNAFFLYLVRRFSSVLQRQP